MAFGRCHTCGSTCSRQANRCRPCAIAASRQARPSKAAARERARHIIPVMIACAHCGARENLGRHHPDIDREPDRVVVLCWKCHAKEDRRLGKWGEGARAKLEGREHVYRASQVKRAVASVLVNCGLAAEAEAIAGLVLETLEAK